MSNPYLSKVVPMDLITGWEDRDSPYYQDVNVKLKETDGKAYISLDRDDILLDSKTIDALKKELDTFQRQIDAGK
ncbi:MAG: hypothetical protein ACRC7W_04735 [Fusobacteriaceae bacterium]